MNTKEEVKVGDRVGAVRSLVDDVAEFYGYGVYEGDFVPPTWDLNALKALAFATMSDLTHTEVESWVDSTAKNPRIRLDSGQIIWGHQCWWEAESVVIELLNHARETVMIDPDSAGT